MKHFRVMITREQHYIESCEVEVCAADEAEATKKAIAKAEEDGDWVWYDSLDINDGNISVGYIYEIDKEGRDVEIERKEISPKRGEMPVDR